MKILQYLLVACVVEISSYAEACLDLPAGKKLRLVLATNRPVCLVVAVMRNRAGQINAEQSEDVKIETTIAGMTLLSDGFDFGRETLTIEAPGSFRVLVTNQTEGPATSTLSAKTMDMGLARQWRNAELLSTKVKAPTKPEELERSLQNTRHTRV